MKTWQNILATIGTILLLVAVVMFLFGCNQQNKTKVWGRGELPANYISFFGSDNTARLNKAQNDLLNKHEVLLRGIDVNDVNGVKVHRNGLVDYIVALVNKVNRLEQLTVDPNEPTLESRIKTLEKNISNQPDGIASYAQCIEYYELVSKKLKETTSRINKRLGNLETTRTR